MNLKHLTSLDLESCKQLKDNGLATLAANKRLTKLNITRCSQVTDSGLVSLRALTALRSLKLSRLQQITDGGLRDLLPLAHLTTLDLSGCNRLTDQGLADLAQLLMLRRLGLAGCESLTQHGLVTMLLWCRNLTALNFTGCFGFDDRCSVALSTLGDLRELKLSGCKCLTSIGFSALAALTTLESLSFAYCYQLTDRYEYATGLGRSARDATSARAAP
eukprot:gene3801-biopygen3743